MNHGSSAFIGSIMLILEESDDKATLIQIEHLKGTLNVRWAAFILSRLRIIVASESELT